jgi:lipopolysaccharide transport system permease protein
MAAPLANMLSSLIPFIVQFALLLLAIVYYLHADPRSHLHPNWRIALLPLLLVQVAMLALGVGFIITSLTTRYKDLAMGIGFGVQLWMYASSIIFPLSRINPAQRWIFGFNPMVPIIESFRLALLGHGVVERWQVGLSAGICCATLLIGVVMFNRVEQTVMDSV